MIDKLYKYLVDRRNKKYDQGIYQRVKLNSPVISIGNLSAGGAGKTPLILLTAELLNSAGISSAIVGHGYKRISKKLVLIRKGSNPGIGGVGDEAALLAKLASSDICVAKTKTEAAVFLDNQNSYEVILVDDGFQHRKLDRKLDIVIIDNATVRNPYLLPKGRLREPLKNIERSHVIIFRDIMEIPSLFKNHLTDQKIFFAKTTLFEPIALDSWNSGYVKHSTEKSSKSKVIAMSGLARNTSFHKSLKKSSISLKKTLEFKDHYKYSYEDIITANKVMEKYKADHIAITEKDAIKIVSLDLPDHLTQSIFVYPMRLVIDRENEFSEIVTNIASDS